MEKRAQGRPCRGASEVGRQRIVEGVRNVLRSKKSLDISRKCLAIDVGVTPALITYYFPKKESLMEEVVAPVIQNYRLKLEDVVSEDISPEEKLRKIIKVLANLYGGDSKILSIYKMLEDSSPDRFREVTRMTIILSEFFVGWRGVHCAPSFDAAVLQGAVRGMCEFAERMKTETRSASQQAKTAGEASEEESDINWLEPLQRLFTVGRDLLAAPANGLAVAI